MCLTRALLFLLFLLVIDNEAVPGGIYFRVSQKGVDYVTELAAEAFPQLLENTVLPPISDTAFSISNLLIEKFDKPHISARFVKNRGVAADLHLPRVKLNAVFEAGIGFLKQKGKFRAELQNLTVEMVVVYRRNESANHNIIEVPVCNVSTSSVRIVFAGGMSTGLNLLRGVIERTIVDELAKALCQISIDAALFIENEKRQMLTTTPRPSPSPSLAPTNGGDGGDGADGETEAVVEEEDDGGDSFGADLCAPETVNTGDSVHFTTAASPIRLPGKWAMDLTLRHPPVFTNEDIVFGLDGGAVYFGETAKNISRPQMLNVSAMGDQMIGFLISEYVPNTFFSHYYDNGLGVVRESLRAEDVPRVLKGIARLVCANCELQLIANLTGKPVMSIDDNGVRLDIQGDVSVMFKGKKKMHDIVHAHAQLDVTVKPYLKQSRVYGDVSLTNVDVLVKRVGVGGMFANTVRDVLNVIVPKKLWPKIKRRLRFALNKRGIKLPVLCGVELDKLSLKYIPHAVVLDTDFTYDLPHFVSKFKTHMQKQLDKTKKTNDEEL